MPRLELQTKYLEPLQLQLATQVQENFADFRKIDWYSASDVAIGRYLKSGFGWGIIEYNFLEKKTLFLDVLFPPDNSSIDANKSDIVDRWFDQTREYPPLETRTRGLPSGNL